MLKSVQSSVKDLGVRGCLVVLFHAILCLTVSPLGAFLFILCLAIPHMWWVTVIMWWSPWLLGLALTVGKE